jgi:leucyl aminopeptidase (aminopeptidase T)
MVSPALLKKTGEPLVKALQKGTRLRLHDANGTDLTLGLAHRPARAQYGTFDKQSSASPFGMLLNLPAGAVRVALDESVAEGTYRANRSAYYDEGVVTGAEFHFAKGKLTDSRFDSGGEIFEKGYATGGKGRDLPGFLSIGLNPELRNTPQVEDLEAGAVLVSLGGNAQFGGKTQGPFFGFAVNSGVELEIDGARVPLPSK